MGASSEKGGHGHGHALAKRQLEPPIFDGFDEFEEPSIIVAVLTYLSYAVLIVFGHLRDFMRKVGLEKSHIPSEKGNVVCLSHPDEPPTHFLPFVVFVCGSVGPGFPAGTDLRDEAHPLSTMILVHCCVPWGNMYARGRRRMVGCSPGGLVAHWRMCIACTLLLGNALRRQAYR